MEETLAASLRKVFDVDNLYEKAKQEKQEKDSASLSQSADLQDIAKEALPEDMGGLIRRAVQQYELALERQKEGDWAGYGEALQ